MWILTAIMGFFGRWQSAAIAAAVALVIGGGMGYKYASSSCNAAAVKAEVRAAEETIDALRENIREMKDTVEADGVQAVKDAEKLRDLQERARRALDQVANGVCLSAADVERLRSYFRLPKK